MTEELQQRLKNLKLSYSELLTRLLRAPFHARQEGALEWRIRRANRPERGTLETFPFARPPGVNRQQIRGFAELECIAQAENIGWVGKTGVGKTGLAIQHLFQADGGALPPASHHHHHPSGLPRVAQLSGQPAHGGGLVEPPAALLPYGAHRRSVVARAALLNHMDSGLNQEESIRQVLEAYRNTPGTMGTVHRADRLLAAPLYQRGLSLQVIENALVLAAARRLVRPAEAPPLGTIRWLAYFLPVIEEVLELRVSPDYFESLRYQRARIAPTRSPALGAARAVGAEDGKQPARRPRGGYGLLRYPQQNRRLRRR
jgi:hypothetical protein